HIVVFDDTTPMEVIDKKEEDHPSSQIKVTGGSFKEVQLTGYYSIKNNNETEQSHGFLNNNKKMGPWEIFDFRCGLIEYPHFFNDIRHGPSVVLDLGTRMREIERNYFFGQEDSRARFAYEPRLKIYIVTEFYCSGNAKTIQENMDTSKFNYNTNNDIAVEFRRIKIDLEKKSIVNLFQLSSVDNHGWAIYDVTITHTENPSDFQIYQVIFQTPPECLSDMINPDNYQFYDPCCCF